MNAEFFALAFLSARDPVLGAPQQFMAWTVLVLGAYLAISAGARLT